jgi:hypothetical protein
MWVFTWPRSVFVLLDRRCRMINSMYEEYKDGKSYLPGPCLLLSSFGY